MTEQERQNAIVRWLARHGFVRVFRQNTGRATFKGRTVQFGTPGQGDLRCIVAPLGRLVEIEVKSPTGRQSVSQRNYQRMLEGLGAVYVLARSVADVWDCLRSEFPSHVWHQPEGVDDV